ncbi:MAG: NAD(+) salvage pathway protein [Thelocarpon superellum]|nr:MAG: NAD(+) salvage pathway protein [Thelocarpon superellum]
MDPKSFRPALIIVDVQEDFCPPVRIQCNALQRRRKNANQGGWPQTGSLAVPDGRTIAPIVNRLLDLPFVLKVATKDWHPANHVSFASNHPAPDNQPFTSFATIPNPENASETFRTRLWPVHCVQHTAGAELIPELDRDKLDHVVEKGQDARVEMYSALRDPYRDPPVHTSGLPHLLRQSRISHVYVVGLAMDYCVKFTALDCSEMGLDTYVVREGTRAVDAGEKGWDASCTELERAGVTMVSVTGEEVSRVRDAH